MHPLSCRSSDEQRIAFINDSFPIEAIRENKIVAAFLTSIEAFIFISIVIFHVITIVYHKRPSIKSFKSKIASPLLHWSIYCCVRDIHMVSIPFCSYQFGVQGTIFCQLLWGWCLPIGFTLSFSPVAMRTWRIYRFKHYLNPGPLISDPILIGGVLLLLLFDVVIAIIWTSIDPFYVEEDSVVNRRRRSERKSFLVIVTTITIGWDLSFHTKS